MENEPLGSEGHFHLVIEVRNDSKQTELSITLRHKENSAKDGGKLGVGSRHQIHRHVD